MKKVFIKFVSLIVGLTFIFSLSACSFVEEFMHVHDYIGKNDEQSHWLECSCGEIKDKENHIWGEGVTTLEPTVESFGERSFSCSCGVIKKEEIPKLLTDKLQIHFLTLGNDYAGDCIYVKAGDTDILIDGGSRANSVDDITSYVDKYVTDGTLEYVVVTHADQDHIACFGIIDGSLFDYYECEVIIDFPLSDKTTKVYERYQKERADEVEKGARHFTALECYEGTKEGAQPKYQLADDISMEILYNHYYENKSSHENNYSVCLQFVHGTRKFIFTGDLEEDGEQYLVQKNELGQVELYKAGHHGSKTSSSDALLDVIKPKICVVTCSSGTDEYTKIEENQFPTQAFIDRISKHTDKVYVTTLGDNDFTNGKEFIDMNGNIVILSLEKDIEVICSNNSTLLKDTDWFKNDRNCPKNWLD